MANRIGRLGALFMALSCGDGASDAVVNDVALADDASSTGADAALESDVDNAAPDVPVADSQAPGDTAVGACDDGKLVRISGTASMYYVTTDLDPTATLAGATLALKDPILAVAGKESHLMTATCEPARLELVPGDPPTGATFDFPKVDTSSLTVGLIATIDEDDDSAGVFLRTSTGLAAGQITADTDKLIAFAVTRATEAVLAPLMLKEGKPGAPGDLEALGFILGVFVDTDGVRLRDVRLVTFKGDELEGVIYPSLDYKSAETDGDTSDNGVFILPAASLAQLTGEKPGYTFAQQQAASTPGGAFLVTLIGTPQ